MDENDGIMEEMPYTYTYACIHVRTHRGKPTVFLHKAFYAQHDIIAHTSVRLTSRPAQMFASLQTALLHVKHHLCIHTLMYVYVLVVMYTSV